MPGPVQTVQGAVFVPCRRPRLFSWGGDNLNVVRHVGRLLDGCRSFCPAELLNDGDLIMLVDRVLEQRDGDTDRVTKVKGHADAEIVRVRQVRESDKLGKDAPDEAGGLILLSLMHVVSCLVSVGGGIPLLQTCIVSLLLFLVLWLLPLTPHAVRNHAMLPGSAVLWTSDRVGVPRAVIVAEDVGAWPYSVGLLIKWVTPNFSGGCSFWSRH